MSAASATARSISTIAPGRAGVVPPPHDPRAQAVVGVLDRIRSEEFDYEILRAASDVMGEDVVSSCWPSPSYLPPEKSGDGYYVTVFAKDGCETCPIKRLRVGGIEPKVRALAGG